MSQLPTVSSSTELAHRTEPAEWHPQQVVAQVQKIQQIMHSVMKRDVHYGVIPGTDKPTLLKPGAEKLALTFRFATRYEIDTESHGMHRTHTVKCVLTHMETTNYIGEGLGVCSTLESKYRYRQEVVGEVPREYWDTKDQSLIGEGNKVQKRAGKWVIVRRVENPDVADMYNTVLKMAKKRAFVDAILSATAASDIFAQDLEEMAVESQEASSSSSRPSPTHSPTTPTDSSPRRATSPQPKPAAKKKVAKKKTARKQAPPAEPKEDFLDPEEREAANSVSRITEKQRRMAWAITFSTVSKEKHGEWGPSEFLRYALNRTVQKDRELDDCSIKEVSFEQASQFLDIYSDEDSRNELYEEWKAASEEQAAAGSADDYQGEQYEDDENIPF